MQRYDDLIASKDGPVKHATEVASLPTETETGKPKALYPKWTYE
jgi:hypothetical protein